MRFRSAVRALILDPDDHLLLARFEFPTATIWALPGGGIHDGETPEAGLRRELYEELGVTDVDIGPHIWSREHVIPMMTGHDGQRDQIHLIRSDRFEPLPTIGWDRMRAEYVHELRWWSIPEVAEATATLFAPRAMHHLLETLMSNGVPAEPIDTGV